MTEKDKSPSRHKDSAPIESEPVETEETVSDEAPASAKVVAFVPLETPEDPQSAPSGTHIHSHSPGQPHPYETPEQPAPAPSD